MVCLPLLQSLLQNTASVSSRLEDAALNDMTLLGSRLYAHFRLMQDMSALATGNFDLGEGLCEMANDSTQEYFCLWSIEKCLMETIANIACSHASCWPTKTYRDASSQVFTLWPLDAIGMGSASTIARIIFQTAHVREYLGSVKPAGERPPLHSRIYWLERQNCSWRVGEAEDSGDPV
eukprot:TRINITY_DN90494_c0_g1_i1.p1 TRINITY_DN90494_c0_g1~~TRINITY_DN90494_c0_g1_i1.p1  ORF type:complete len:178 (-),score=21.45 TRINITY_DN90494_c0_g1_i1:69-602(-)